jgi:hypothetical protein
MMSTSTSLPRPHAAITALSCALLLWTGCASQKADAPAAQAESNAEITNNQEAGVDEGGIVKNIGDHLVVLRQGRLFAVNVASEGLAKQTGSIRVARDEALNSNVWYDEMLVRGRDIYVIGFRYATLVEDGSRSPANNYSHGIGATEISHFTLGEEGELTRAETLFLESADYYDSSNYASRMIDGQLVFYIPYASGGWHREAYRGPYPSLLDYMGEGRFRRGEPILTGADIQRPPKASQNVLHTVVVCQVEDDQPRGCKAKAVSGGWWRTRYITSEDVFLWSEDRVWKFSLRDGSIKQHAAYGYPRDQFAFKLERGQEDAGDKLHVLVQNHRTNEHSLDLLSLSVDAFDESGEQELDARNTRVVMRELTNKWLAKVRFVDDWVLFTYTGYNQNGNELGAHHIDEQRTYIHALPKGNVTRLEPMYGVGALVSQTRYEQRGWWRSSTKMSMHVLSLEGAEPVITDALELDGAAEAEARSHAFFFKPNKEDGGGVFGLPVTGASGHGWWGRSVANIAFFDVSAQGTLALEGAVSASSAAKGTCETSCVDWYGNTRPIFLRDRIFALMGSELAEVALGVRTEDDSNGVKVVQRVVMD